MNLSTVGRIAAALVAVSAWTGLVVQFVSLYDENSSLLLTLWVLCGYFTITTNLLVALVFTALALQVRILSSGWIVAGTMLCILLVGVVYGLVLHGSMELSGGSVIANALNHMLTPALVPLFWLAFARKGDLSWQHPFWWALYPLAYLAYGLVRGAATGKYAYPFLDVTALSWRRVALNAFVIAVMYMLSGFAIVWVDHLLGRQAKSKVTAITS